MNATLSIALSGLNAASTRLDAASHSIANLQTPRFHREQVQQEALPQGGVKATVTRAEAAGPRFEGDVVEQLAAGYAYVANLHVIQSDANQTGSLFDALA